MGGGRCRTATDSEKFHPLLLLRCGKQEWLYYESIGNNGKSFKGRSNYRKVVDEKRVNEIQTLKIGTYKKTKSKYWYRPSNMWHVENPTILNVSLMTVMRTVMIRTHGVRFQEAY